MKSLKKTVALLLGLFLLAGAMAGCSKSQGYDFTCTDATNSTPNQQKWLKCPDSVMVINPDAVSGEDQRDMTKDPLSFGITDASGNVIATYDDALFLLETASANGHGGSVLEKISWDGSKGLSKVEVVDQGERLAFNMPEGLKDGITARIIQSYNVNYTDPSLYLRITVDSIPEKGNIVVHNVATTTSNFEMVQDPITEPGSYTYSLKGTATKFEAPGLSPEGNKTTFNIAAKGTGHFSINEFQLIKMEAGYRPADKAASTVWNPYSIKASLSFPNESELETLDYFFNENTLVRKITPVKTSDIALAGKVYGTCTYDESNSALCFENGSSRYIIFVRKGIEVSFYPTYEDLMAGTNAAADPSGAVYWAQTSVGLTASENDTTTFYVGISGSDSMSMSDLMAKGSGSVSATKAKKIYSVMEDFWNDYIAGNEISAYIETIPE